MNYVVLQDASAVYYLIDFAIVLAVLLGLRVFSGAIANVSLKEILSRHDNFAAGISLAGAVTGIAIMLMGAVSGEAGKNYGNEALLMAGYGLVGIIVMWLTRLIFDRVSLPHISVHGQIMEKNTAAGIVDAGNLIATAIMVRAVMIWVDGSYIGLAIVFGGYVVSQVVLYLATLYRLQVFKRYYPGDSLQREIESGNVALALRFAGHRIGVALAVTATSGVVVYHKPEVWISLAVWAGVALAMFIAQTIVAIAARHVLLPGIDVAEEVVKQKNVAIGVMEATVYIAVGFVFVGLLA